MNFLSLLLHFLLKLMEVVLEVIALNMSITLLDLPKINAELH